MKPERPGLALRLLALLLLCLLLALLVWMRTLPTTAERPAESPVPQETPAPVPTPAATERPAQSAAPTAPVPTASDPTGAPLVYTEESYRLVSDLVYTYAALQREGEAEIREGLARLKEADPRLGGVWEEILGVWDYVNTELAVPASIPEGLPQDESLCIVVLGFQLHADGSMAQELLGRCQTALAAAERYPRARIAVTGGGTAFQNRAATEAGVMAQWLRDQGIGEERILIEDRSLTTADNAVFTCELLRRNDPSLAGVDFTVFRKEATRFFAAGWSVADLQYALTTRPDGMPWPRGEGYQGTEWLEHRLRRWKTPNGSIRPSISQEKAQLRVVSRAGLPPDLGLPHDEPRPATAARPEVARTSIDDARRLVRAHTRTTGDSLVHRDRTQARMSRSSRRG